MTLQWCSACSSFRQCALWLTPSIFPVMPSFDVGSPFDKYAHVHLKSSLPLIILCMWSWRAIFSQFCTCGVIVCKFNMHFLLWALRFYFFPLLCFFFDLFINVHLFCLSYKSTYYFFVVVCQLTSPCISQKWMLMMLMMMTQTISPVLISQLYCVHLYFYIIWSKWNWFIRSVYEIHFSEEQKFLYQLF